MAEPSYRMEAVAEPLEPRMLLSSTSLIVSQVQTDPGVQLVVTGTDGNDHIALRQIEQGIVVADGNTGWWRLYPGQFASIVIHGNGGDDFIALEPNVTVNAWLFGGQGDDTLIGGSGDDWLYGQGGRNVLVGGEGDDVLVTIGADPGNVLSGGGGRNVFWLDTGTTEWVTDRTRFDVVHRVNSYFTYRIFSNGEYEVVPVSKEPGLELLNPLVNDDRITYMNFAGRPLFASSGAAADDVSQGNTGNCFFLAALSSMAAADGHKIRQHVADLGDGTYVVQFYRDRTKVFVRVDADMPVWKTSQRLAYADLGAEDSLWVAVMEKAFAFFRRSAGTYQSIASGWMDEVYRNFGMVRKEINREKGSTWLLRQIQKELDRGRAVSFAVKRAPEGSPLIDRHAYMVDSVERGPDGRPVALRLRNPWGIDGAGDDGAGDGYVTVSARQARDAFWGIVSARVA
jgi:hypothetical protein